MTAPCRKYKCAVPLVATIPGVDERRVWPYIYENAKKRPRAVASDDGTLSRNIPLNIPQGVTCVLASSYPISWATMNLRLEGKGGW